MAKPGSVLLSPSNLNRLSADEAVLAVHLGKVLLLQVCNLHSTIANMHVRQSMLSLLPFMTHHC